MTEKEQLAVNLQQKLCAMGYPPEFGQTIAASLATEKSMKRMLGYLNSALPLGQEEIVDEMIAILEDHARWRKKKEAEYYNSRYNELLNKGLEEEIIMEPKECK